MPNKILTGSLNFIRSKRRIHRVAKVLYNRFIPKKIIVVPHYTGFFSCFNKVMNHLVCSLNHDFVIAIEADWRIVMENGKPSFPYGRPEDGNIWGYFFEPLPFHNFPFFVRVIKKTYKDDSITGTVVYNLYKSGQEWRNIYHAAFSKYIKIKPHIQQKVQQIYSRCMEGKYCIGIHIRDEAHKCEQKSGSMPTLEEYVDKIKKSLPLNNEKTVIYLATDVEKAVEDLSNIFGDKIITQSNVKRSSCHGEKWYNEIWCKNLKPEIKMGEEVLIDCLLLARCDVFIHTTSNIATAVGYINPNIKMVYCE